MQRKFRSKLLRRMFLVFLGTTLVVVLGTVSFISGHDKIGDPFLGVFYGENLIVTASQRADWPGVKAGILPGDRLLAANNHRFTRGADLAQYLWNLPHDSELKVELERQSVVRQVAYILPRFNLNDFLVVFVAPCSLGIIFLIMGVLLFCLRPRYTVSLVYFLFCALTSLASMVHFELFSGFQFYRLAHFHSLIVASALHLFLLFPERQRAGWRYLPPLAYTCALLIMGGLELSYFHKSYAFFNKCDIAFLAVGIVTILAVLIRNLLKAKSSANEDKIKVMLLGCVLGLPLILFWAIGNLITPKIFFLDQAVFLFLLFPIFLGYATLRRNILDIDRVIRVGISYGLLGAAVFILYLFLVSLLGQFSPGMSYRSSPALFTALVILAALMIGRSFDFVQNYLMRNVFKGRYQIIRTLQEFTDRLSRAHNESEAEEILVEKLVDRLGLSGAALLRYDANGPEAQYRFSRIRNMESSELALIDWSTVVKNLPENILIHSFEKLFVDGDWSQTSQAVVAKNRGRSLLCIPWPKATPTLVLLGERQGDKELTRETLDLLPTIAKQAALTLENAYFHDRDAAREKLAALGKVASIMIHEVKNPLGIIRVSSETIRRRLQNDVVGSELAEIIVDEISRMDGTIQRFLNFAKPDPLMLESFEPDPLIQMVVDRLRPDFEKQQASIICRLTTKGTLLQADPEKLRRLLFNLLINAKEASAEGRANAITIQTHLIKGRTFLLTVKDHGKGIDESMLNNIFQPFFSTKRGSTGLGLSIVQQIVQDHHGEISVTSTAGQGSQFQISLPLLHPQWQTLEKGKHDSQHPYC